MDAKRLYHTVRLWLIRGPVRRAEYLKKHGVFKSIGDNCSYMRRVVPLYAGLISFGNGVIVSSNVGFITHDGIHRVLNLASKDMPKKKQHAFRENLGCIEIGNNVFIGAGSRILCNVRIGDNVIVTTGSIVTTDVPSNSVVRGTPAKYVCSFEDYYNLKANKDTYPDTMNAIMGKKIGAELEEWLWDDFNKSRS